MKISEVMEILKEFKEEYGNLEVLWDETWDGCSLWPMNEDAIRKRWLDNKPIITISGSEDV